MDVDASVHGPAPEQELLAVQDMHSASAGAPDKLASVSKRNRLVQPEQAGGWVQTEGTPRQESAAAASPLASERLTQKGQAPLKMNRTVSQQAAIVAVPNDVIATTAATVLVDDHCHAAPAALHPSAVSSSAQWASGLPRCMHTYQTSSSRQVQESAHKSQHP